jgi:hypothetical protein
MTPNPGTDPPNPKLVGAQPAPTTAEADHDNGPTQTEVDPITSDAEHAAALTEIDRLLEHNPPSGTPESERLDALAHRSEVYEREHPEEFSGLDRLTR